MSLIFVSVTSNALRQFPGIKTVSIYGVFTPLFAASKRAIFPINIV
jgi:hypothetical protein